jgi:acetylornithine deacetylase/succinyl-diaminopimelate desuccinylase-like protein
MTSLKSFQKWAEQHHAAIREDYFHFLRFKSISADPAFAKDVKDCAVWLRDYISKTTDMKAELLETEGYPLVYAEDMRAGEGAPTVLIYGHYDVQPVDPLELWESPPFEPTIRNGKVYARGAVDDKGQIFYAVLALRAWKELGRRLPINLKFCIEGEEESASVGLSKSLSRLKHKLKADSLLVVDFDQYDAETPALSMGARGLVAIEVTLTGSKGDLHSGSHGGTAYNPNKAMVQLLSKLWDDQGRVVVEGFYDDVVETTEAEREKFAFRYDRAGYSKEFGIDAIGGEKGRSLAENNMFRPTIEINGIGGGYFGAGLKTVIPAHCTAKISCRLVPDQDPRKIEKLVTDFLRKHVTHGMKIQFASFGGEAAFRGNASSSLAKAVATAAEEVTGKVCRNTLAGGSVPIVARMIQELGAEVVGMGYGLPTDDIHAPNEHFDLKRLEKGFLTVARAIELL